MRATLEIDDDLLRQAEQIARDRGESTGRVVSDLLRQSIGSPGPIIREGFPVLPKRDDCFHPELALVNSLRDDE